MKKILLSLVMLCSMTAAWAQDDGFVNVATCAELKSVLNSDAHAKVRLTADINLSENTDDKTFCSTFYGVLDGNGYTIKGDNYPDNTTERRNRNYLFTYSEGATFKNLTFKHIRKNSQDHSNQAIITSQAKNNCVFENITFENVGNFSNYNNVGAAAGYAYNSTFTNITVKNSDFTVDDNYVGSVVGDADKCTFTNIEITNCKTYAHDDCAGGVVGHSRNCKFIDVTIHSGHLKADGIYAGGVAGKAVDGSTFTHCVTEDQVSVFADGTNQYGAYVGGISGFAAGGSFLNCINSALILSNFHFTGGIVGYIEDHATITGCLNTGMTICDAPDSEVSDLCDKYKKKQMSCVTKKYNGIEYTIRSYRKNNFVFFKEYYSEDMGGIVGYCKDTNISQCANIGELCIDHCKNNGGIAGEAEKSNIKDCLLEFEAQMYGGDGIFGIVYNDGNNQISISNCVVIYSFQPTNNDVSYYSGFVDANGVWSEVEKSEWATGKYCLKLGENWEQNLGTDPYPMPTGNKGLHHTRKVSNQFGTVCLPFALKSDDKISYYSLETVNREGQDIKFVFKYAEDIEEGIPALFRSTEAKDASADNPVEICFNNAGNDFASAALGYIRGGGVWDWMGTFEQKVYENDSAKKIYYVSDGKIKNAKKTTIAPYRAYLHGQSIDELTAAGAKAIQIEIEDEDGQTTALELVGNDLVPVQQGVKAYSLMGTEVGGSYRGIVIKNGKKVLIK